MQIMNTANVQLRISYGLQLIMLIGVGVALWKQQGTAAGLAAGALAITLIPFLMKKAFGVNTPPPFLLFLVIFVFGSLFLGEAQGLYRDFWWWDLALHLGSGFLLGIVGLLLVYVLNGVSETGERMRPGFVAFFAFLFAVAVGAFWEILEFVLDIFFTLKMQTDKTGKGCGLTDSMSDLSVDAVGALVIALIAYWHLKHKEKPSFLGRWIGEFIRLNPQLCGGEEKKAVSAGGTKSSD